MDYVGIFLFGIIFAVIAFIVRAFTDINLKQASLLMLAIFIAVTIITEYIGLRSATSQAQMDNVTAQALDSVIKQGTEHLMFELGGALVGSFLGILFGGIGKKS